MGNIKRFDRFGDSGQFERGLHKSMRPMLQKLLGRDSRHATWLELCNWADRQHVTIPQRSVAAGEQLYVENVAGFFARVGTLSHKLEFECGHLLPVEIQLDFISEASEGIFRVVGAPPRNFPRLQLRLSSTMENAAS